MQHYAQAEKTWWRAACGAQCFVPDELTDRKSSVRCTNCRRTKIFREEHQNEIQAQGETMIPKRKKKSLYGNRPKHCPVSFEKCGGCNIYPCLIGKPAVAQDTPSCS